MSKEELLLIRNIEIHKILGIVNNGRRLMIRCPFPNHNDSTPSFVLNPNNSFKCFGCGRKGSGAIDFCQHLGYSFVDIINELKKYL